MRQFLVVFAVLFVGGLAAAQTLDLRFKGTIDVVRGSFVYTTFPDGGETTEVTCFADEAGLADGGTWKLKVDNAGPVVRDMPNPAVRVCKRDLLLANRMDGGT